ncbi:hypothetical protein [Vibrio brasiliensis]|uniref:hypothetical protein n=1 Tax=Vibrio brasiliensis TaxID=170652 RepID=UPI001EFD360E|nr:hypothetical protein [Vibrio brasiliensis]MCG9727025.1 hypothetical protein [Vibrio brasiliensis]
MARMPRVSMTTAPTTYQYGSGMFCSAFTRGNTKIKWTELERAAYHVLQIMMDASQFGFTAYRQHKATDGFIDGFFVH